MSLQETKLPEKGHKILETNGLSRVCRVGRSTLCLWPYMKISALYKANAIILVFRYPFPFLTGGPVVSYNANITREMPSFLSRELLRQLPPCG